MGVERGSAKCFFRWRFLVLVFGDARVDSLMQQAMATTPRPVASESWKAFSARGGSHTHLVPPLDPALALPQNVGLMTQKSGTLAATGIPAAISGNTFNAANEMTRFGTRTLACFAYHCGPSTVHKNTPQQQLGSRLS